ARSLSLAWAWSAAVVVPTPATSLLFVVSCSSTSELYSLSLHDALPIYEISWSDLHATCCEFALRQKPARGLQAGRLLRVLRREGSRGTWEFCGRLQHRQWEHWWKHARARCNRDSD